MAGIQASDRILDWVALLGTGPRGCAVTLRASAYLPRVPSLLLLFDKTPGTSRKPGLEEGRALVSTPGPEDEGRGSRVLLALVTSESGLEKW